MLDVGRPLTFNPHLSTSESPITGAATESLNYQGFINLMIISLIVSHIRLMYENYIKYGWMFSPSAFSWLVEPKTIAFIIGIFSVIGSSILVNFTLESMFSKLNYWIFNLLHILNFSALLAVPVLFHKFPQYFQIHPRIIKV